MLRIYDFSRVLFTNLLGVSLPRRQQVDIVGFEGSVSDDGHRILLRATQSDSLYNASMAARPGQFDGERVTTVGYDHPNDGGDASFRYYDGSSNRTSANGVTRINTSDGLGQWRMIIPSSGLTAKSCGVKENVVDTAKWNGWLAAACNSDGKHARLTSGSYVIGNTTPNITADGVTIEEDAGATIRFDVSIMVPNVFEQVAYWAVGRSGLQFRLGRCGAVTHVILDGCVECSVTGGSQDGRVIGGSYNGYHWPVGIRFVGCERCTVSGTSLGNLESGLRLDGDNLNRCVDSVVTGNLFWADGVTTRPGNDFVSGVYVFFADESVIRNNTFRNLVSAVPGGNAGNGMGYGIYEGDGACRSMAVGGNTFVCDTGDTHGMVGIYVTTCHNLELSPNTFRWSNQNPNSIPVWGTPIEGVDPGAQEWHMGVGSISMEGGSNRYAVQVGTAAASAHPLSVLVSAAVSRGGRFEFGKNHDRVFSLAVRGNKVNGSPAHGITLLGDYHHLDAEISENTVEDAALGGILITRALRTKVLNNTVLDCNQSADFSSDTSYSGISFASFGIGSTLLGNRIGNRPGRGGNLRRGVNAGTTFFRIYKWIFNATNTIFGMAFNVSAHEPYFYDAAPLSGIDFAIGDRAYNYKAVSGDPRYWDLVDRRETTLGAALSSASGSTVTVADTTGMQAGDKFEVFTSYAAMETTALETVTNHYAGEILSITDGTHFEATAAIPAIPAYNFPIGSVVKTMRWSDGPVVT